MFEDDITTIVRKIYVNKFVVGINSFHKNKQYTVELEENGSLPFLDVHIIRLDSGG